MLNLSKQELIVLFELCHRICETSRFAASHPAEIVVIDKIAGDLERSLSDPFSEDYPQILNGARDALLEEYRRRMGRESWIETVALDQI